MQNMRKILRPGREKARIQRRNQEVGDKTVFGGKQQPRSRPDFGDRKKHVPVLDSKICTRNRAKRTAKCAGSRHQNGRAVQLRREKNRFYAITLVRSTTRGMEQSSNNAGSSHLQCLPNYVFALNR